jgi:hypothetical protein
MTEQTAALLELMALRDTIRAALDELAHEHVALARRRLRDALARAAPPLALELGAARQLARAARSYVNICGPALPAGGAPADTAYRVLVAALSMAEAMERRAQLDEVHV